MIAVRNVRKDNFFNFHLVKKGVERNFIEPKVENGKPIPRKKVEDEEKNGTVNLKLVEKNGKDKKETSGNFEVEID